MARTKGTPAYPKKSVLGSYYISKEAARKLRAASKRTGKSASDIIEHGIMAVADAITPQTPRFGPNGFKEVRTATE